MYDMYILLYIYITYTTSYRRGKTKDSGKKDSKEPFLSVVRRARINTTTSTKFAEYEVSCQLRLPSVKVEKEKVFQWSVWKRYSDFEQLEVEMRSQLGWQMEHIEFPSAYNFTFNKLSTDFIEMRR
jgi:hypothetical protein